MAESMPRSILKALSWRVIATLITATLAYLLTGSMTIALEIGALDVVLKLAVYYLHERIWNRVSFGLKDSNDLK